MTVDAGRQAKRMHAGGGAILLDAHCSALSSVAAAGPDVTSLTDAPERDQTTRHETCSEPPGYAATKRWLLAARATRLASGPAAAHSLQPETTSSRSPPPKMGSASAAPWPAKPAAAAAVGPCTRRRAAPQTRPAAASSPRRAQLGQREPAVQRAAVGGPDAAGKLPALGGQPGRRARAAAAARALAAPLFGADGPPVLHLLVSVGAAEGSEGRHACAHKLPSTLAANGLCLSTAERTLPDAVPATHAATGGRTLGMTCSCCCC